MSRIPFLVLVLCVVFASTGCSRLKKLSSGGSNNTQPVIEPPKFNCQVSAVWSAPNSFRGLNNNEVTTWAPNIITTPTDELYAVGTGVKTTTSDFFIRKSIDRGETWQIFAVDAAINAASFANFVHAAGAVLYLSGAVFDGTSYHWAVYRSANQGQTWAKVDDFQGAAGADSFAMGIGTDAQGAVYVVGSTTATAREVWTVRKSPTGAAGTWTTVDTFSVTATSKDRALNFGRDGVGALYVGGFSEDNVGGTAVTAYSQVLRKSTDNGTTWANASAPFQLAAGKSTKGITYVSGATIFQGLGAIDANNIPHWLIRRSVDGGVTFNNIDDVPGTTATTATSVYAANAIAADAFGNVWAGGALPNGNVYRGVVRRSANGGNNWASVVADLKDPDVSSLTADSSGNVFFSGSNYPNAGAAVRKYAVSYPRTLSQTCLSKAATMGLAAGRIYEFEPKYALWTDAAIKRRWIYLPEGTKIDNSDESNWRFPVGTQVFKEFARDGKKVETRVLLKVRDGVGPLAWQWNAYRWRVDQTDADIFTPGEKNSVGTQHDMVATSACVNCHGGGSDFVLGIDALQMKNQGGFTLASALIFSYPTGTTYDIQGSPNARAALGYLHANCGHCHNPTGLAAGTGLFVRHNLDATSVQTETAYMAVNKLSFNPTTPFTLIIPANIAGSYLRQRMAIRSPTGPVLAPGSNPPMTINQMPRAGTDEVDTAAVAAIDAWITELVP